MESGVPEAQLQEWTSHCFRRGSGVDVLAERGVAAMVEHGGWSSARAAEPYATADEQTDRLLSSSAALAIDLSDDDV